MSRTTSGIPASSGSSAWMTRSTPSPSTRRSPSVTSAAISMSASRRRSRPVISQSIHTRRSFTRPAYSLRSGVVADDTGATRRAPSAIAAGYAVEGGALELGTDRRRRAGRPGGAGAHPAGDAEPPRPRGRRDRYRQDEDAAGAWPGSCRTPGCRCCSPTSRATCPGWRGRARTNARDPVAREGHRRRLDAHGLPRRVPLARRQEQRRRRSARRSPSSGRSC